MNVDVFHKIITVPLFDIDVDIFLCKDFQAVEDHAEEIYPGIGLNLDSMLKGASVMMKHPTQGLKVLLIIDVESPESFGDVESQMLIQATHIAWILSEMLGIDVYIENHTTHSHILKFIFNKLKETYREAVDTTDVDNL